MEADKLARKEAESMARVVTKAVELLDPKGALTKHAAAGKAALDHAKLCRLKITKAWDPRDYDDICAELKKRIEIVVPITDPRPDEWVKAYLFVELVRPMLPAVEGLSYFQCINTFTPAALSFNKKDLEAELREGWVDKVRELLERQLSAAPMKMAELDLALEEHKAALKAAKDAELTESDRAQREHEAAVKLATKEENRARSKLSEGITAAAAKLKPAEIVAVIEKAGVTLPNVGPDPARMTPEQCKQFVALLLQAGNATAILVLYQELGKVIAQLKQAAAEQAAA
jgi:hypothetical protein